MKILGLSNDYLINKKINKNDSNNLIKEKRSLFVIIEEPGNNIGRTS